MLIQYIIDASVYVLNQKGDRFYNDIQWVQKVSYRENIFFNFIFKK